MLILTDQPMYETIYCVHEMTVKFFLPTRCEIVFIDSFTRLFRTCDYYDIIKNIP